MFTELLTCLFMSSPRLLPEDSHNVSNLSVTKMMREALSFSRECARVWIGGDDSIFVWTTKFDYTIGNVFRSYLIHYQTRPSIIMPTHKLTKLPFRIEPSHESPTRSQWTFEIALVSFFPSIVYACTINAPNPLKRWQKHIGAGKLGMCNWPPTGRSCAFRCWLTCI